MGAENDARLLLPLSRKSSDRIPYTGFRAHDLGFEVCGAVYPVQGTGTCWIVAARASAKLRKLLHRVRLARMLVISVDTRNSDGSGDTAVRRLCGRLWQLKPSTLQGMEFVPSRLQDAALRDNRLRTTRLFILNLRPQAQTWTRRKVCHDS